MDAELEKQIQIDIECVKTLQSKSYACYVYSINGTIEMLYVYSAVVPAPTGSRDFLFRKIPKEYQTDYVENIVEFIGVEVDDHNRKYFHYTQNNNDYWNKFEEIYLLNPVLYSMTISTSGNKVCFIDKLAPVIRDFTDDALEYLFDMENI